MLGTDYTLTGSTTIPAGQTSTTLQLNAIHDMSQERRETAKLTLTTGTGYKFPKRGGRTITIKINNVP